MKGNMQNMDLTIPKLIEHAERYTSDTLIVSRETDNSILKKTTGECLNQSRKIAKLLQSLKVGKGDRVATIAWNNSRHFEIYFGVTGMGGVLHTINPRLFPEQLIYILNHAEDKVVFVDDTFLPLIEGVQDHLEFSPVIILMGPKKEINLILKIYIFMMKWLSNLILFQIGLKWMKGMRQHCVIPLELRVIQREFSIVTGPPCYIPGHQEMH